MGFFGSLFAELGARRRRLRKAFGERGQSLFEFSLIGAFALSTLGLFIYPWMASAAPWGFAIPIAFALGYLALDVRRQTAARVVAEGEPQEEAVRLLHDRLALAWSVLCIAAGVAAFVFALNARPPAPIDADAWRPPENAVAVDLTTP
jgi:hypothetical protein